MIIVCYYSVLSSYLFAGILLCFFLLYDVPDSLGHD